MKGGPGLVRNIVQRYTPETSREQDFVMRDKVARYRIDWPDNPRIRYHRAPPGDLIWRTGRNLRSRLHI